MEPDRRKVLKMMAASAAALFPNAAPAATQV